MTPKQVLVLLLCYALPNCLVSFHAQVKHFERKCGLSATDTSTMSPTTATKSQSTSVTSSDRLKKARLRLAEAQGIIPFGASENPSDYELSDLASISSTAGASRFVSS